MANIFNLDEPFNITVDTESDFWSSPNNTNPYQSKLPAGEYSVKGIYYDGKGVVWYLLDVPSSMGVACYLPAGGTNAAPSTPEDDAKCKRAASSNKYSQYVEDQNQNVYDEEDASTTNANNTSDIQDVGREMISANFELVTYDGGLLISDTSQAFQYYIEKTRTTFGLPPQWNEYVDLQFTIMGDSPTTAMHVGRVYSNTIYSNPTILSLTPGDIEFVTDNDSLMDILTGNTGVLSIDSIEKAAGKNSTGESFFRFVERWDEYIGFLNETNKFMTVALGATENGNGEFFANKKAPVGMFSEGKVSTYKNIDFADVLGSQRLIGGTPLHSKWVNFALSGQTTSQDSFSTSTRATALENLINSSFSDIARDVYFMLGGIVKSESLMSDINQVMSEATSELGSGFTGLIKAAGDILNGGHIDFPQVIDDCSYGKTLSVTMRFVSPYGDIESRYLNVLLPYMILFTLAIPRQLNSKYDVYSYPFIVKASCKGIFACDCGAITRLEVVRGGTNETEWTADGHPTAIDVQMDITPLHSKLMQSKNDGLMIKNVGLQHYLGSICGIDLTASTKTLMIETAKMLMSTGQSGIIQTGWDNMIRTVDRHIQDKFPILSAIRASNMLVD